MKGSEQKRKKKANTSKNNLFLRKELNNLYRNRKQLEVKKLFEVSSWY